MLTPRQRAHLRGLAHHLEPVVHIGRDGISEAVVKQIDEQLAHHELIKVRLGDGAPLDRDQTADQLPAAVGAELVQNMGKVFVLYRANAEDPVIELPSKAAPE
jgi:RNA-binding protein